MLIKFSTCDWILRAAASHSLFAKLASRVAKQEVYIFFVRRSGQVPKGWEMAGKIRGWWLVETGDRWKNVSRNWIVRWQLFADGTTLFRWNSFDLVGRARAFRSLGSHKFRAAISLFRFFLVFSSQSVREDSLTRVGSKIGEGDRKSENERDRS